MNPETRAKFTEMFSRLSGEKVEVIAMNRALRYTRAAGVPKDVVMELVQFTHSSAVAALCYSLLENHIKHDDVPLDFALNGILIEASKDVLRLNQVLDSYFFPQPAKDTPWSTTSSPANSATPT